MTQNISILFTYLFIPAQVPKFVTQKEKKRKEKEKNKK